MLLWPNFDTVLVLLRCTMFTYKFMYTSTIHPETYLLYTFRIYTGILKFVRPINNIVVQAVSGQFYHLDMPFAPTHTYWAVKLCYVNSNCNFYSCTFSIVSNKHVATVAEAFTLMISTLLFYKNIQYRQFELEK